MNIADGVNSVFIDVLNEHYCVARIISEDELRDYEAIAAAREDGTLAKSCRCKGWRRGGADCWHLRSMIVKWYVALAEAGMKRVG